MNTVTIQNYRDDPSLAFALHEQARRARALAIGRLFKRLFARIAEAISALRRPNLAGARWG